MYKLLDFGDGRKLEQFAQVTVDRPSPAADGLSCSWPKKWSEADAKFVIQQKHQGQWTFDLALPDPWILDLDFARLQLFTSQFGHVGLFAEQMKNWQWLSSLPLSNMKLLNLFAYTGGSTLAAAKSGASVVHVDSAKNMVQRARHNAELSGMQDLPIRWIVEDASRFVQREVKRGNHYDGVILDPPTYGHGVKSNDVWKIDQHLPPLIEQLKQLVPQCRLMLFSCHTETYTSRRLLELVDTMKPADCQVHSGLMTIETDDRRKLASGYCVRWFN